MSFDAGCPPLHAVTDLLPLSAASTRDDEESRHRKEEEDPNLLRLFEADLSNLTLFTQKQSLKPTPSLTVILRILSFVDLGPPAVAAQLHNLRSLSAVCQAYRYVVSRVFAFHFGSSAVGRSSVLNINAVEEYLKIPSGRSGLVEPIDWQLTSHEFEAWRMRLEYQFLHRLPDNTSSTSQQPLCDLCAPATTESLGPIPAVLWVNAVLILVALLCLAGMIAVFVVTLDDGREEEDDNAKEASRLYLGRRMLSCSFVLNGAAYLWQILFCKMSLGILVHAGCLAFLVGFATLGSDNTGVGGFFITALAAGFMAAGAAFGGGGMYVVVDQILVIVTQGIRSDTFLADRSNSFATYSGERAHDVTSLFMFFTFAWNLPLHVVLWLPPDHIHTVGPAFGYLAISPCVV